MQTDPQARLSIVAYRPKPGQESELMALTREHVPYLRNRGLASERPHIIARASDGTIVEVFEWVEGGLARAHADDGVKDLWTRFGAACDFVPLSTVAEANMMFANFVPVD